MEFYSKTDVGKVRDMNQDAVKIETVGDNCVWSLVCDGMGGAKGGDVASSMSIEAISSYLDKHLVFPSSNEEIKKVMYSAVNYANKEVFLKSKNSKNLNHMGTTVVLCIVNGSVLHVIYAGDSRVYLIGGGEITQLTKDHSVVQEMVDSGEITLKDALIHPQKNIITRAVGVCQEIDPDYVCIKISSEDIILSCTDGLTNHVGEKDIYSICSQSDFSEVAKNLVKEANDRGGTDNITVSAVKL